MCVCACVCVCVTVLLCVCEGVYVCHCLKERLKNINLNNGIIINCTDPAKTTLTAIIHSKINNNNVESNSNPQNFQGNRTGYTRGRYIYMRRCSHSSGSRTNTRSRRKDLKSLVTLQHILSSYADIIYLKTCRLIVTDQSVLKMRRSEFPFFN